MSITISKNLASYDLLHPSKKQWSVAIHMGGDLAEEAPDRHISELWDSEDEPEIEGEPPSVVARLIRERVEHYWIYTARSEKLKILDWMDEHAQRLDAAWAAKQIERLEQKIAELRRHLPDEEQAAEEAQETSSAKEEPE